MTHPRLKSLDFPLQTEDLVLSFSALVRVPGLGQRGDLQNLEEVLGTRVVDFLPRLLLLDEQLVKHGDKGLLTGTQISHLLV